MARQLRWSLTPGWARCPRCVVLPGLHSTCVQPRNTCCTATRLRPYIPRNPLGYSWVQALDMCVRLMLPGEVAALTSSWQYAYEGRLDAPSSLQSGCSMEFEVELIDFEKEPTQHALSGADKLKHAARLKEQGNMLFKQV